MLEQRHLQKLRDIELIEEWKRIARELEEREKERERQLLEMKRVKEQQELRALRDLEEKRRQEEVQARNDWAKKVDALQQMLMRRKYAKDVENQRKRKSKLKERLRL